MEYNVTAIHQYLIDNLVHSLISHNILWPYDSFDINLRGAPQSHFFDRYWTHPGWFSPHVYRRKSPNPVWSLACTTASAPQPNLKSEHRNCIMSILRIDVIGFAEESNLKCMLQREVKPATEPWLQAESTYPSSTRYGGFGRFQGTCNSFLAGLGLSSKCHVLAILAIPTVFQLKLLSSWISTSGHFCSRLFFKVCIHHLVKLQDTKTHVNNYANGQKTYWNDPFWVPLSP